MRALTLRNPYAALVAHGHKRVESRGAPPAGDLCPLTVRPMPGARLNRGDLLLIHAAMKNTSGGTTGDLWEPLADVGPVPYGAIVATARLAAVAMVAQPGHLSGLWAPAGAPTITVADPNAPEIRRGDYSPGRWAWFLSDVHRLAEPVPCKGRQGVWIVDYRTYHQVVPQLPEAA